MSRTGPFLLAGLLALFTLCYGALPWLAGGLYLDSHEGDSYHLLDVLTRMERGDVPHLDFVTPLGALAFWPVHWLMEAGQTAGASLVLAQLGVALCLLPFVIYAASTRLSRGLAAYFGCVTLGLVLALSYGTATSGVSISMHYNRWAWAVSFVMLLLALVPARATPRPVIEGSMIGLLASALLLLKITYFVTLVPVAAIGLARMYGLRGMGSALVAGLVVVAVVAAMQGPGFWLAYLADLRLVAGTEFRPNLGTTFGNIVASPMYIGATIIGLAAAMMIRRIVPEATGLAVLLMVPGFLYIAYQNFGNDPQWLFFLPVLLLALRPATGEGVFFGADLRTAMSVAAVAGFAIFFPSFFNIATSPLAHLSFDKSRFLPMLPDEAGHQDIYVRRDRAFMTTAQVYRDQEPGAWARYGDAVGRAPVAELGGVSFPHCEWQAGSRALLETLGADLAAASLSEDSTLFTADLLAAYWFFAPVRPAEGSAPWYYGGLTGMQNTDYVMVPKCAFTAGVRDLIIRELAASEFTFTLVRNNDLMALYRVE